MSGHPQRLYGVVGHPVAQSLSPVLHNWGFARCGMSGVYMAWDKAAPELPAFIQSVRSLPISGLSVTIPNKQAVMSLLDRLTPTAEKIGAVNTLYWEGETLVGGNTDLDGFLFPLEGKAPPKALILGAGGAARAVLAGLAALGTAEVAVAARSTAAAAELCRDFDCTAIAWEDRAEALCHMGQGLVVNTTPIGMYGKAQGESPLPEGVWPAVKSGGPFVAYDIIYTPRDTVFLQQARAHGWRTLDGLPFFVAQGLAQFRLWTGQGLPFAEALTVVEEALEQRRRDQEA